MMPRERFPIVLKNVKSIAPSIRQFSFLRQDGSPFDFLPGQFVTLHFEHQGLAFNRSYSLANSPSKTPEVEFAANHYPDGPASTFLFNLKEGAVLNASGPFGRLVLRDQDRPKRFVLVATTTGVTPFRSMIPELEHRMQVDKLEVALVLGARCRDDLIYIDEWLRLAQQYPLFRFYACLSQDRSKPFNAYEQAGYVQHSFPSLSLSKLHDIVYLCGNPSMIDQALIALTALGFESSQIRREKYISPKK